MISQFHMAMNVATIGFELRELRRQVNNLVDSQVEVKELRRQIGEHICVPSVVSTLAHQKSIDQLKAQIRTLREALSYYMSSEKGDGGVYGRLVLEDTKSRNSEDDV